MGDLAKETSVNSMRALYAGEETARLKRLQAQTLREQGEFAQTSGLIAAGAASDRAKSNQLAAYGTLIQGAGSLYAKYSGMPSNTTTAASGTGLQSGGAGDIGLNYG